MGVAVVLLLSGCAPWMREKREQIVESSLMSATRFETNLRRQFEVDIIEYGRRGHQRGERAFEQAIDAFLADAGSRGTLSTAAADALKGDGFVDRGATFERDYAVRRDFGLAFLIFDVPSLFVSESREVLRWQVSVRKVAVRSGFATVTFTDH